jgi:predicted transcriptional regulator
MVDSTQVAGPDYIELSAEIAAAFVSHNALSPTDLPKLIAEVYAALKSLGVPAAPPTEALKPAVSIRKSITPDYLICLEDGKKFKTLKRHLRTAYELSPEQYREKWGLPSDYPMVAPNYTATRSAMALYNGLGRKPNLSFKKSRKGAS